LQRCCKKKELGNEGRKEMKILSDEVMKERRWRDGKIVRRWV